MRPPLPVPSDVYESTFAITGTANATVIFGSAYLIGGGFNLIPVVPKVTLDGLGNGSVTCTPTIWGSGALVTLATVLNWSTPLPANLNATANCTASSISPYGEFSRQLATLIGPARQASDGSKIAEDYRALSSVLTGAEQTLNTLVGDMFPDTTTDLVGRWEIFLGLVSNPSVSLATRQANLLAKWRALFGGQPLTIQAALQSIDPLAQVLELTTTSLAASSSNPNYATVIARRVFMFGVTCSAATVAAVLATGGSNLPFVQVINQMKPAHTNVLDTQGGTMSVFAIGTKGPFLCDDPNSLTDQTLLST